MLLRAWRISLAAIMLIGSFLILPLGTINPAAAQEPDVDISVAYGWWVAGRLPNHIRLHISKNRLYDEWGPKSDAPLNFGWSQYEGHFRWVDGSRYLFIVERAIASPGEEKNTYQCKFAEVRLKPSTLHTPPRGMTIDITFYHKFEEQTGFSDECGRLPWYVFSWPLRQRPAKPK